MHRRRLALILASNTVPERPCGPALDAAGITGLFRAVLQSHELGYRKPDQRFFTKIVEQAGVDPDVIPALDAGMHAALVAPAGARCGPLPRGAIRISHICELPPVLSGGVR